MVLTLVIPSTLPQSKQAVRDYLRQQGLEEEWTRLQGHVYGNRMREAKPFEGIIDFLKQCQRLHIPTSIISHKTLYPYLGPQYNLHESALDWLDYYGFYAWVPKENIFFELTKEAKIERIRSQACTHFIDDLPEFLTEPSFPSIHRLLFDPENLCALSKDYATFFSWSALQEFLLGL